MYRSGARFCPLGFRPLDRAGEISADPSATAHWLLESLLFESILSGVHGLFGARHQKAFAREARRVNVGFRGDHYRVRRRDVLGRKLVLRPDGTLCFDLDRMPEGLGGLLQSRGCHEGVSNASWTRGYCHESLASGGGGRRWRCGCGRCCRGGLCLLHRNFGNRFRRKQRQGRADHVPCIANCLARRRFQNRLPSEPRRLDANIRGQNHDVCLIDIILGEDALFPGGALRLHLDLVTKRRGNFLQGLGRHDCVRYAGGTGGDSNDFFHREQC